MLAPPEPTQRWLAARRPTVQLAIATKKLLLGMSRDEMVAAMGEAPHQFVEAHGERQATVAWYSRQEAVLVDGAIVALRPPRPLAIEPRRP